MATAITTKVGPTRHPTYKQLPDHVYLHIIYWNKLQQFNICASIIGINLPPCHPKRFNHIPNVSTTCPINGH
jgi:hypothetical protein